VPEYRARSKSGRRSPLRKVNYFPYSGPTPGEWPGIPRNKIAAKIRVVLHHRAKALVQHDPLIILARDLQLLDVFLGDVLLALPGFLNQAKVRGLGVLEFSFAPLLLALKVFDEVHYALVYYVPRFITFSHV
jgi:hypothetical protein